jgi:hypothetical protein
MHAAIVSAGLFSDEADALLNTWEISYFKSPGLRLFYLCPRNEIEEVLPLSISPKPDLTRVLIGRIEVVTPEQRALLHAMAGDRAARAAKLEEYSIPEQPDEESERYQLFAKLGRFRSALLLEEQTRQPSLALAKMARGLTP